VPKMPTHRRRPTCRLIAPTHTAVSLGVIPYGSGLLTGPGMNPWLTQLGRWSASRRLRHRLRTGTRERTAPGKGRSFAIYGGRSVRHRTADHEEEADPRSPVTGSRNNGAAVG